MCVTSEVMLIETHASLVFLAEAEVFKVKKPVNLGFLDFSTKTARRAACEAEVELNRRLAPEIYKGMLPVRLGADGRHALTGDGPIVDWAVHMVRLPDALRADVLLSEGSLGAAHIDAIAARIAELSGSPNPKPSMLREPKCLLKPSLAPSNENAQGGRFVTSIESCT